MEGIESEKYLNQSLNIALVMSEESILMNLFF